ncbi:MAG: ImmA/IrrE family metallo-endopeptidase [Clostridiales bacterium]|nr:ImmA/IrrE family metallo-endopeptidase [Clostridiales bacterium]
MNEEIVKEIVSVLEDKLKSSGLLNKYPNRVLRGDIVEILDELCTVVYYPLEKDSNNGFHRIIRSKGEAIHFVYINTAQTIDKQVFTAAHELGHLWEVDKIVVDRLGDRINVECNPSINEEIINRFAAELLMPKNEFVNCLKELIKENEVGSEIAVTDLIKIVVQLMDRFLVPFKAVLLRFGEIGVLSSEDVDGLLHDYNNPSGLIYSTVNRFIDLLGYTELRSPYPKKYIKDFAEMLAEAEAKHTLSDEKIKALREEFGITQDGVSIDGVLGTTVMLRNVRTHDQ